MSAAEKQGENIRVFYESEMQKACRSWTEEKAKMVKQMQQMEIENERLSLRQEQTKKEFNAKLLSTETVLLKERKYYGSVKKQYDNSVENCSHLTEKLELLRHQLNVSETLCNELKRNLEHASLKKSKIEDNLSKLQKEMDEKDCIMKEEAEKYSSEIAKFSRELKFKDQALARYEQEMQHVNDQMQKVIYLLNKHVV